MQIEFSKHALSRFRLRGISKASIERILKNVGVRYYDIGTRNLVTIGKIKYKGKVRSVAVVYQEVFGQLVVITAHPIVNSQIHNRVLRGRWINI